ncbi:hypothetical protein O181_010081 [Austropuccinia psidii MF-1]|uniref:Uncharacterized protein n=1 Tax=Austropuccinia psidii MF-1 TaxID=1389203 RepID=A0A9Q3GK27_9BASI|nr:hypothetical protein [Austropuccinia psidii MF-1]
MHPILKDPGVVHIWYDIPLCTLFAQKSNGDIFRTKLSDSKSSPQSITIFEGAPFSYSIWHFPGSYQKTIQGPQPPHPAGAGLSILIRTTLGTILRGSNQASCMALAQLGQFIFHCGKFFKLTRAQAVLTPTPRAPLDGTPAVLQLRAPYGRKEEGQEGVVGIFPGLSRTTPKGPGEDGEEEEENSVQEEESDGTEGVPAPVGASQGTGGPTLAQSDQPVSHQSEPYLFAVMHQMTQSMANF